MVRHSGLTGLFFAVLSTIRAVLSVYCIACSLSINVGFVAMIAVVSIAILVVALPISITQFQCLLLIDNVSNLLNFKHLRRRPTV